MSDSFWNTLGSLVFNNEADVEVHFVLPLLGLLGYDKRDIRPKVPVNFKVGRKSGPGRKPEADFVVYGEEPHVRATSLIVVETKNPNEDLSGAQEQAEAYTQNLRAPIFIITNGVIIQVWQLQVTTDSICIIDCKINDLYSQWDKFSSLLSKEALKHLCKNLEFKRFDAIASDYTLYEVAELNRVNNILNFTIDRNVRNLISGGLVDLADLIADDVRGSIIVGSSGYGKTTASAMLLREAIERRREGASAKLPIEVFLPGVSFAGSDIISYIKDRISSHVPTFVESSFRANAMSNGLIILADGFDRVRIQDRDLVLSMLRNILRDYPKIQIHIFSRAEAIQDNLSLPIFEMLNYKINDFLSYMSRRGEKDESVRYFVGPVPRHIEEICKHPLLARLVVDHYEIHHDFPNEIIPLYEEWIDRILSGFKPVSRALHRELMAEIAERTYSGPINIVDTLGLMNKFQNPQAELDELINSSAFSERAGTLELKHEILADYLRAKRLSEKKFDDFNRELELMHIDASSQLPFLLVATARTSEASHAAWKILAERNLPAAIGALRFATGSGSAIPENPDDTEIKIFFSHLLDGIESIVKPHFASLETMIYEKISGLKIQKIGVCGNISGGYATYSFFDAADVEERVSVGDKSRKEVYYGRAVYGRGFGLEAGRGVGVEHVKDALMSLANDRVFHGDVFCAFELVLSRIRNLKKRDILEENFPINLKKMLDKIGTKLESERKCPSLAIEDIFMLEEFYKNLTTLMGIGLNTVDFPDCIIKMTSPNSLNKDKIADFLDYYYKNIQYCYYEFVSANFASLTESLPTYRMMPLKFEIEIEWQVPGENANHNPTMSVRRLPIASFENINVQISFINRYSEWFSQDEMNIYENRTDELLLRLGRFFPERRVVFNHSYLPDLTGDLALSGDMLGETPVVRAAMRWLKDDLSHLFGELPSFI